MRTDEIWKTVETSRAGPSGVSAAGGSGASGAAAAATVIDEDLFDDEDLDELEEDLKKLDI